MNEMVYGRNSFDEALRSGRVRKAYLLKDSSYISLCRKKHIPFEICERKTLDQMSDHKNHQGVIAETEAYELYPLEALLKEENGLIVALDSLKDPQNLGTIVRTVDVVGADGIIYKKHNSVKVNATVAKVASGALEYVKIAEVVNLTAALKKLKEKGYWIVGAAGEAKQSYDTVDYKRNIVLVIGAEGEGISRLVKEECDYLVSIPNNGHIDSLNASVAAGVMLYQVLKDRQQG